ncbi:class I SAM-dependent methyltransferase [Microlunatus flavus]|uniref:class I SAM-dependent methyltransferase n=1 Tax=Microlunatus flavus TaxID=1036181 RepID=UPI0018E06D61|nr:class I SAM-dependent methyltransferase [Microlunatus flavus]
MRERALVFGTVADAYEEHRLGYPDAVADLVLGYARPTVARALEVGAGTGKATRLFAGRGPAVTACEPDPAMGAVLARTTRGLPVVVVTSTFEGFALEGPPFDLLYAASAWHWTKPATRWDRTAALVRPGGTVALFGSTGTEIADPALEEAVERVRRTVLPDESLWTEGRSATGMWWPGSELEADDRFTDVEQHDLPRRLRRSRAEHLALLGTLSTYLQLPADVRQPLLARIGEELPDEVEVDAAVRLHLARRR